MPVPGDVVHVRILEDGQALVERIDPRIGTLERRSSSGRAKTIAANVDLLVAVTALANPAPRLPTLDQLLAFAELEEIQAAVVFTKPDLAEPALSRDLIELYAGLEYPSISINPKSGETLYSIANAYRTTVAALKRDNRNVAILRPGMILIVQSSR